MICPNCDHWNDISVEDMPYECDKCFFTLWADMLQVGIEFEEDDLSEQWVPAEDDEDACDCPACLPPPFDVEKRWDD